MNDPGRQLDDQLRRRGWLILGGFVAMIVYLVTSHHVPGAAFIGCPFRWLTGFSCFGCGMTRSTAHFLHADLAESLRYHPFGFAVVLAFAASAGHHLVQNVRGVELDYRLLRWWRRIQRPVLVVVLLLLGAFGIVRLVLEISGFLTPI